MDKHLLTGTGMDHGGWLQSWELRFLKNADLPDSALSTHMLPTVHKTKAGPAGRIPAPCALLEPALRTSPKALLCARPCPRSGPGRGGRRAWHAPHTRWAPTIEV